mmetsp:Transcript_17209/g.25496  ORF Transcript_17209/g.25496 Transcript_17209/m.25496 type:complete len:646 (+) Transcript_17209:101-2038(+)|eukprot:CAMPEP_0171462258 /NCGR_PEP_ID=MMETSP0945-20130129/6365_1 /TAXON_ID=109269 /ORGANISM="Vaucheria litorea, Strain CCMP2940" /LENGTH=645 /DNA_ID=CAMNT_0011988743 /DNA_START=100 /DNA_END=2037 /DNA_ORIENTATION=+
MFNKFMPGPFRKRAKSRSIREPAQQQFNDVYRIGEVLGKGAFSTVRLATRHSDGKKFAIKVVSRRKLPAIDEAALRLEAKVLVALDHPNIVRLFGWFEEKDAFYVPLEYCEGGDLFTRVVERSCYTEKDARDLVRLLLEALKYCHERGIMHRDLKPENLLLTSKKDDANIKIADFGFAKVADIPKAQHTQCGTPGYVAPEILKRQPYGMEVDMWSVGVICYILLGGYPPFHDDNQVRLFMKIKKGSFTFHPKYWDSVSSDAKDLIRKMLVVDPKMRITAAEALQHPWIKAHENVLAGTNLGGTLVKLKTFNANRKFKSAINAVVLANRLTNLMKMRKFSEHYEMGPELGSGACSVVHKCISKRPESKGTEVAVKIVKKLELPQQEREALNAEIEIMLKLRHPNILRLIDSFQDDMKLYMVIELARGGELFDRIVKKVTYNESEARNLIRSLLRAISFCHSRNIVHRDLKPENLLLVSDDDDATVKVADFGFADYVSADKLLKVQCGTPGYVAPEILMRQPYGKEVDMWSMGVICYVLLGGYPPFYDDNQTKLFMKIRKGDFKFHTEYWENISSEAKDLISCMLTVDPSKRITAEQALKHPFFKLADDQLETTDMGANLRRLKLFNARRKFRSAIHTIIAVKSLMD